MMLGLPPEQSTEKWTWTTQQVNFIYSPMDLTSSFGAYYAKVSPNFYAQLCAIIQKYISIVNIPKHNQIMQEYGK